MDHVTPGSDALAPPFDLFLFESSGDLIAARRCAKALLHGADAPPSIRGAALLLLTATCVYLHGRTGPDPRLPDLLRMLKQLRPGLPGQALFAASPVQFLQYVAAELADGVDAGAIDLAIRQVMAATL